MRLVAIYCDVEEVFDVSVLAALPEDSGAGVGVGLGVEAGSGDAVAACGATEGDGVGVAAGCGGVMSLMGCAGDVSLGAVLATSADASGELGIGSLVERRALLDDVLAPLFVAEA